VVILDFVGNFGKNWVAPLALGGFFALLAGKRAALSRIEEFQPPAGCYVGVDTRVREVWRGRLEALFKPTWRSGPRTG